MKDGAIMGPFEKVVESQGKPLRETSEDPFVEANRLIREGGGTLVRNLDEKVHKLRDALASTTRQLDGLKRLGSDNIEAPKLLAENIRPVLEEIQLFTGRCVEQIDDLIGLTKGAGLR